MAARRSPTRDAAPAEAPQPRRRLVVRLVLTAGFGALALSGIGVGTVVDEFGGLQPGWAAAALPLIAASYVVGALRWRLLLRCQDVELGVGAAVRYTWLGLFVGNALPTGFGGDAARAWVAGRRSNRVSVVTASVLADRLIAVWTLMALGAIAAVVDRGALPTEVLVTLGLACAAVLGGSVVLLAPLPARWLARALARSGRLSLAVQRVSDGLRVYVGRRGAVAAAVALSIAAQVLVIAGAWMLARSLSLHLSAWLLATTIPVALLATAAPTSINGLGVREAVFRALLVPAGVAPAQAVAFSLATVAAGTLVSIPGAFAWIHTDRGPAAEPPPGA